MIAARPVLAALLVCAFGYVASPYVTLYRLNHAVRSGDAATLARLVDWSSVREGIKEDLCDVVADNPATTSRNGQLPAFGASFARGIAANAVDRTVTPERLASAANDGPALMPQGGALHVDWAFFDGPAGFTVALVTHGQTEPIRLQLQLQDGGWLVTRVWLPPAMLAQANART